MRTWKFPKITGTLFGVPGKKDYNIVGSILGFPLFWELTTSKMEDTTHYLLQERNVRDSV